MQFSPSLRSAPVTLNDTSAGVAADIDMAFYVVERVSRKDVTDETARLHRRHFPRSQSNVSHALRGRAVINN